MTYSQPDPAEETDTDIEPEQPDTDVEENVEHSDVETETDVQSEDVETSRDTTDETEGGGAQYREPSWASPVFRRAIHGETLASTSGRFLDAGIHGAHTAKTGDYASVYDVS